MANPADSGYRAWLGLELEDRYRHELAGWLSAEFDPGTVSIASGSDLIVRVMALVGRRRQELEVVARAVRELDPGPVRVGVGAILQMLPSRQHPRLYLLPTRCYGIEATIRSLKPDLPATANLIRAVNRRAHLPVGWIPEADQAPVRRPTQLPERLRGPVDAVRFGLYCSRTTPEQYRLDPLAQVKLPMPAAVR